MAAERDPKVARPALTWLFLAMVSQRQGKAPEARDWLAKAAKWREAAKGLPWHEQAEVECLYKEASAVVEGKP